MVAVGRETDQATRTLTQAWIRSWDELAGQWQKAMDDAVAYQARTGQWPPPWELGRIERLGQAMQASEQALQQLANRAGVVLTDGAEQVAAIDVGFEPRLISSQLPAAEQAQAAVRFAANVLPQAVDVIVARSQAQIVSALRPLSTAAADGMRRELVRGIATGTNPSRAAAQMVARVQGEFNGGLSRAINVARTEMLDTYRTVSRYSHAANADVVASWIWISTLDKRTCPSCWGMNGTTHPLDQPGPLDHQQGRCARAPKTKTWRDLGFDIDEPADDLPDAQKKFWALSQADQKAIMGPGRLQLLRSGRIGWDDLPGERASAGWRTSYAPRTLGDLERIAARRTGPAVPPVGPRKPGPPLPSQQAPKIERLIADLRELDDSKHLAEVAKFVDGRYAGLDVKTTSVMLGGPNRTTIVIGGDVLKDGEKIGWWSRQVGRDKAGNLVAYHGHLEIKGKYRGSGFADEFNGNLMHWYRRSGVSMVELYASSDVGGYAWASKGYDFANATTAAMMLGALREQVTFFSTLARGGNDVLQHYLPGVTKIQVRQMVADARALLKRAGEAKFGTPGFPTAYEMSQLGRWPGAGKGDLWIGKRTMLGSSWDGVLRL
jgi:SPP1 gp7 family putative phage head morphogenesis protein